MATLLATADKPELWLAHSANGQREHRIGMTEIGINNDRKRSLFVSRTRLCTIRRNTTTWCRSATFSASSRLFDLNGETKMVRTKHSSAIIVH